MAERQVQLKDGAQVTGRTYPDPFDDEPSRTVTGKLLRIPCPPLGYVNHLVAGEPVDPDSVKPVKPTENANPEAVRLAMAEYMRRKLEEMK